MSLRSESEHYLMYKLHRNRIRNAKSLVQSNPPVRKQLEPKEFNYFEVMEKMSGNVRKKSASRTFSRLPDALMQSCSSKSANINNGTVRKHKSEDITRKRRSLFDVPAHIYRRYGYLSETCNTKQMRQLLRPKIFMDLEVKGLRCLGRMIVQLYTEACPEVVLEFVRACTAQDEKRFKPLRFFPPLWCESELVLENNNSLTSPNAEHDMNVLDHGVCTGILSFPVRYIRGLKHRSLSFAISFKPIKVLNGKRIAFGKIRRGNHVLQTLQEYSNVDCKVKQDIIISKCGLVK